MITQAVTVSDRANLNIIIGRRGTYETQTIVFDVSYLVEKFGNGSAVLMVKRPMDITAYPAITEQDSNTVTWVISETDTQYKGHGECELFWYVDGGLAKSVLCSITVLRDIGVTTEEPPDPYETWVDTLTALGAETLENAQAAQQAADEAEDAIEEFTNPTASATTLPAGSQATASYSEGHFTFGIPQGQSGERGADGQQGEDGFSPTLTVSDITGGHRITITDKTGTQTVDVMNGAKGDPGQPGQDYVLTAQDKQDIADIVLADLPTWTGGSY